MQKDKNLAPALSTKDKRSSLRVQRDFPLTASLVGRDWETLLDAQTLPFEPEQPHNLKREDFDSPTTCPELQDKGLHWPEKMRVVTEPAKVIASLSSPSAILFLYPFRDCIFQGAAQPKGGEMDNTVMKTK